MDRRFRFLVALLTVIVGLALLVAGLVFVGGLITAALWRWLVPDLFSGLVAAGLLPETISWVQGWKLNILLSSLGLVFKSPEVIKEVRNFYYFIISR